MGKHPYRAALSHDAAIAEAPRCTGTHVDPDLATDVRDHGLLIGDTG